MNNCVGKSNYKIFIYATVFMCVMTAFQSTVSISSVAQYFMKYDEFEMSIRSYYGYVSVEIVRAIGALTWISLVVDICLTGALMMLLGFHIYLKSLKMTTLEYVISKKEKNDTKINTGEINAVTLGGESMNYAKDRNLVFVQSTIHIESKIGDDSQLGLKNTSTYELPDTSNFITPRTTRSMSKFGNNESSQVEAGIFSPSILNSPGKQQVTVISPSKLIQKKKIAKKRISVSPSSIEISSSEPTAVFSLNTTGKLNVKNHTHEKQYKVLSPKNIKSTKHRDSFSNTCSLDKEKEKPFTNVY